MLRDGNLRGLLIFEHFERLVEAHKVVGHEIDRGAPIWVASNLMAAVREFRLEEQVSPDSRTPQQLE
jgi:hypothetical protein